MKMVTWVVRVYEFYRERIRMHPNYYSNLCLFLSKTVRNYAVTFALHITVLAKNIRPLQLWYFFPIFVSYTLQFSPGYVQLYGVIYVLSEYDEISLLFHIVIRTKQFKRLSKACWPKL